MKYGIVILMVVNRKKYQNAILYFCKKLGGELRGKKKLAKLLYFVDFDLYEKMERALTGDTYKALPMGPFPSILDQVTQEMNSDKSLKVSEVVEKEGYNPTEVYKCVTEPDLSIFDEEELAMMERVIVKYGQLNGKQLEELSHAEAPFIGTEQSAVIPYELAFYRGTDFEL